MWNTRPVAGLALHQTLLCYAGIWHLTDLRNTHKHAENNWRSGGDDKCRWATGDDTCRPLPGDGRSLRLVGDESSLMTNVYRQMVMTDVDRQMVMTDLYGSLVMGTLGLLMNN